MVWLVEHAPKKDVWASSDAVKLTKDSMEVAEASITSKYIVEASTISIEVVEHALLRPHGSSSFHEL